MDWGKLKEKALGFKDKAVDLAGKTVEKGKEYGGKAMDFTSTTMSKAPVSLKILADFEKVKNVKFLIILFIDKTQEETKNIMIGLPLILKNAWVNGATFKTVDIKESSELSLNINVSKSPYLIIYKIGEEIKRIESVEDIKKFLKDFII